MYQSEYKMSACFAVVLGGGEEPDPGGTGSFASVCHWKVCLVDLHYS